MPGFDAKLPAKESDVLDPTNDKEAIAAKEDNALGMAYLMKTSIKYLNLVSPPEQRVLELDYTM